ncbi:sigma 54-interacting transcriptional regulator [Desertibacillus haloalkaliphilus]|nr:sigma 54-interacting transcriptional regulator [Desertibacillus haloalkaliphilus]
MLKIGESPQFQREDHEQNVSLDENVYHVSWHPVIDEDHFIGGVLYFRDISEKEQLKQSLNEVQKLNRQLDSIINASYDAMYLADESGRGVKVSRAYERITGVKPEELIGKKMSQVVEEGIVSESVTEKVIGTQEPVTIVQNVRGKEVLVTGSPVFDEKGDLINVVTNIRDISELNELKKDLQKMKALSRKYYDELAEIKNSKVETDGIITQSTKMKQIINVTKRVAHYDSSILILGESGVGKELIARLVHNNSNRKTSPFIKVNCGAIPHELLESELFGYEGGAFTGANKRGKPGMFELANNGTLFLDEVGELALDLQVKLLRAVQELEITRVGGTQSIAVNVRIISATNRDLLKMTEEGKFRKDLYYRLNIVPIHVPPLRERRSDIIPLTFYFINKFNKKYGMNKSFSHDALTCLKNQEWSGNVRELENYIERLVVMNEEDHITLDHFPSEVKGSEDSANYDVNRPLKEILKEFEGEILRNCLKNFKTTRKAAEVLGINQSTLVRKMQKLNISVPN